MSASSNALAAVGSRVIPGWCLKHTRQWFGIGPKFGTAQGAWNAAEFKHPNAYPPAGAVVPVWSKGSGPAGHVAIHLADGSVVTVNGTRVSRFASVDEMVRVGFGAYLGYADDLNGQRVYTTPVAPAPGPSLDAGVLAYQRQQNKYGAAGLLEDGIDGARTQAWRAWVAHAQAQMNLWKSNRAKLVVDGDYGSNTNARAAELQKRNGLPVTGHLSNADAAYMRKYGSNLPSRPATR